MLPLAQRTPHPTSAFMWREINKLRKGKSVSLVCPTLTNALHAIFLTLLLASSNAAVAESLPVPLHVAVAGTPQQIAASVLAARRYAAFWNTGDTAYAAAALAPGFIDRTLPAGRPQGAAGPLQASQTFRSAVPDLTAEIQDMVVAGDRVSVHLRLKGSLGVLGTLQVPGKPSISRRLICTGWKTGRSQRTGTLRTILD